MYLITVPVKIRGHIQVQTSKRNDKQTYQNYRVKVTIGDLVSF